MNKFDLDTPCLLIERNCFQRNLAVMAELARKAGKRLRPHAKTHKSVSVAKAQLAAGNCAGVCAAKVSEAAVLARGGIGSILVTSPVVSPQKIRCLMEINQSVADLMVTVDNGDNLHALNDAASASGKPLQVLVDIDPEMGRTGVPYDHALEFGRLASSMPWLRLKGIQCYCGQLQHIADFERRRTLSQGYMKRAAQVYHQFLESGLCCDVFTGTGTGTSLADLDIPELTDIQVGSYCLMDAEYSAVCYQDGPTTGLFPPALTLLTTVIDVNQEGYVTVDAGTKSIYVTPGAPPLVLIDGKPAAGWSYDWSFGDEHGKIFYPQGQKPRLGQVLELVVSHCDPTINLFDAFQIIDGDQCLGSWPIDLRGCNR